MKIIHVVHDFLRGGIESFLYYLVKEQLKNPNVEVSILCCQEESKVVNKRMMSLDVSIHYIQIRPFETSLSRYNKVLKLVNQFDIIHYQTFLPGLLYFLSFSKPKKVITVHSAGKYNRPTNLLYKTKQQFFKFFISNICDAVVNNSNFTKNFWKSMGVSNDANFVVYNGVNFSDQSDAVRALAEFPVLEGKKIIGTTSRLISWKRVNLLIEAFARIEAELPADVVLLIVGDGDQLPILKAEVDMLECKDKIHFTGYKSNVRDFQQAMDVCVFPSVEEPFGLVAVECLNLGKPVYVMHDGGGLVEIVEGLSPRFVARSVEDLSTLLLQEVQNSTVIDPEEHRTYSMLFGTEVAARKYLDVYKSL